MAEQEEISVYLRVFIGVIGILLMIFLLGYFFVVAEASTDPMASLLVIILPFIVMVILAIWMFKGSLFKQES